MKELFESVHLDYAQIFLFKFDHSLNQHSAQNVVMFGNEKLNVPVTLMMFRLVAIFFMRSFPLKYSISS